MKKFLRLAVLMFCPLIGLTGQIKPAQVFVYTAPFVSTVFDTETSQNFRKNGCYETDPLYGQPPNRGRMYGIGIPIAISIDLLAYKLRHHKGWWAIPLSYSGVRSYAGIHNLAIGCQ